MKIELLKQSSTEELQTINADNQTSQIVTLKNGRNLGYAEYGNLKGQAIFYFHGFPSSRLEAAALHETAMHLDAHIISIDRPGIGLSTFQKGRRIVDFADDVADLSDALNITRFAVMGMSGGAPYVYACALKIPQRITGASIISGVGPIDEQGITRNIDISTRFTSWIILKAPWLMRILFTVIISQVRHKRDIFFWKSLPQPDRVTLSFPFIANTWVDSILEAFRFGTAGPVWDGRLLEKPWGFNPEEITIPIRLLHGQLDRNVPHTAAKRLADRIPNCQATFYPHEGHFSLWLNHMEYIIDNLVSQPEHDSVKLAPEYIATSSSR